MTANEKRAYAVELMKSRKGLNDYTQGGKRSYNSRHVLTDEGRTLADRIKERALEVQYEVGEGIPEEELLCFYKTLEKINENFMKITTGDKVSHGTEKLSGKELTLE